MIKQHNSEIEAQAAAVQFQPRAFINGDYCDVQGNERFTTVNPATEAVLATFTDSGNATVDQAVAAANHAFNSWKQVSPNNAKHQLAFADAMVARRDSLALLDTLKMGMPVSMALDQVDDAVNYLRYNAELIDKVYGEIAPSDSRHC